MSLKTREIRFTFIAAANVLDFLSVFYYYFVQFGQMTMEV